MWTRLPLSGCSANVIEIKSYGCIHQLWDNTVSVIVKNWGLTFAKLFYATLVIIGIEYTKNCQREDS
jgi:hypothetical protein